MSDDGSTARVVEIMEDYYGTHAYSTEAAFTALARDYAALTADRDRLAAELATAQQRIEWASAALHGDPLFGPGCDEPLVRGIQALAAERLAADDARANLLLQTICRLPDVLTEGDWQQWLDQHRDAWLSDDRAFGGWIAQRLREYVERVAADLEAVWRVEAFESDPNNFVVRKDGKYIAIVPNRNGHYLQLDRVARGDSLIALGRALAAREAK